MIDHSLLDKLHVVDWGYTENLTPLSFDRYKEWLEHGHHGDLSYLADERGDKRKHLQDVYPECRSAVSFLFSYAEEKYALEQSPLGEAKIAAYVLGFNGLDYHHVLKERLQTLGETLKKNDPDLDYKLCLDVHPVLERDLALRCGLGWFGKNSMLIHRQEGSFTLIGSLLLNKTLSVEAKSIETDHCGQCRACVDACPTEAIDPSTRTLIANQCVATYTIELFKDAPAPAGYEAMNEIYGCDICQDVCPWNQRWLRERVKTLPLKNFDWSSRERFKDVFSGSFDDILARLNSLGVREFKRLFAGTPLERTGLKGILKNLLHKKRLKS